jgi:cell division protein FtsB
LPAVFFGLDFLSIEVLLPSQPMGRYFRVATDRSPEFSETRGGRGFFGKPTLVLFWFFVLAACCAVAIPALPQYHLLKEIEAELTETQQEEKRLERHIQQLAAEARALEENPRYLQERARDPLRYMLKGETIIQIQD